jgi:uncharacterized protein (DUF433 family)
MAAEIINRGRGPEIKGARITVYDVFDYANAGWHRDRIAALFRLSSRDIQADLDYIEEHREEVMANYEIILERQRHYSYPPEVEAKIAASRKRAKARLAASKAAQTDEERHGRDHG